MTAIAAVPKETTMEQKIRNQVEFYFSDSNLPRDKFLRSKTEETKDGFLIASFKRLRALCQDIPTIAQALRNSALVELDENGTKVRRKVPMPSSISTKRKTIYVKGFPRDQEPDIESVVELFSPYGLVRCVRFRRYHDTKKFKGSAFVEFETEEEAQRAAEEETLKDNSGNELEILSKDEYFKRKKQQQQHNSVTGNQQETPQEEESTLDSKQHERGLILRLDNIGKNVSREEIKQVFESFGEIAWVDYSRDSSEGYIRFVQPDSAKAACRFSEQDGGVKLGANVPGLRILEGEEERNYWQHIWQLQREKRQANKKRRRLPQKTTTNKRKKKFF
eukprot:jgi/Galph1/5393/GphlegSOOS_G4102.1